MKDSVSNRQSNYTTTQTLDLEAYIQNSKFSGDQLDHWLALFLDGHWEADRNKEEMITKVFSTLSDIMSYMGNNRVSLLCKSTA